MARIVYPARSRHTQPGHAIPSQATPYPSQATPYPGQATPYPSQATPYPSQATPCPRPKSPKCPLPDSGDLAKKNQYLHAGGQKLLPNRLILRNSYITWCCGGRYGVPWPWGLGIWRKATTGSWAPQNWGPELGPGVGPTIRAQNWAHNLGPRAHIAPTFPSPPPPGSGIPCPIPPDLPQSPPRPPTGEGRINPGGFHSEFLPEGFGGSQHGQNPS